MHHLLSRAEISSDGPGELLQHDQFTIFLSLGIRRSPLAALDYIYFLILALALVLLDTVQESFSTLTFSVYKAPRC